MRRKKSTTTTKKEEGQDKRTTGEETEDSGKTDWKVRNMKKGKKRRRKTRTRRRRGRTKEEKEQEQKREQEEKMIWIGPQSSKILCKRFITTVNDSNVCKSREVRREIIDRDSQSANNGVAVTNALKMKSCLYCGS
jgi:hypothetical protein